MAHRWSIGVGIGGAGFGPSDDDRGGDDDQTASFRVAELAVRFRATPHFELELATSGGRQVVDDEDGELAMGMVTLAARYRFLPERPWNWYLMGGFGGAVIAAHRSSSEAREDAVRGLGMLGIGVERRFNRFALNLDLRAYVMGERADDDDVMPDDRRPGQTTEEAVTSARELGGAALTFGAAYYF